MILYAIYAFNETNKKNPISRFHKLLNGFQEQEKAALKEAAFGFFNDDFVYAVEISYGDDR